MKKLDQSVFDGLPDEINVACVDFDGLLKFGHYTLGKTWLRFTWASERWRGVEWKKKVPGSGYEPLTKIHKSE